jgi:serine protease Do
MASMVAIQCVPDCWRPHSGRPKALARSFSLILLALPQLALGAERSILDRLEGEVASILSGAAPTVVGVCSTCPRTDLASDDPAAADATLLKIGSGVVFQAPDLVLTAEQLVRDALAIEIIRHDGRQVAAEALGSDVELGIAVLRAPLGDSAVPPIGDADTIRAGHWAIVAAAPLDEGNVAGALGAFSAVPGPGELMEVSLPALSLSLGAPVFNSQGHLVGLIVWGDMRAQALEPAMAGGGSVQTQVVSGQLWLAVPIGRAFSLAKRVVERGEFEYGWLGVAVTDTPAPGGSARPTVGVVVDGVVRDSPAYYAGVRPGDVLLRYDGVDVPDYQALMQMVRATEVGTDILLEMRRGSVRMASVVSIVERSATAPEIRHRRRSR